jgi:hypothetical protein
VAITAGVIGGALKTTGVTLLHVASQGCCAAAFDRSHYFEVRNWQGMVAAIGLTMLTKDVGQFASSS